MNISQLIEKLKNNTSYGLKGYSSEELIYIKNLYDIELVGDFKEFLKVAGRSGGCDFKNLGYEYYFDLWCSKNVRSLVLSSDEFREAIRAITFKEMQTGHKKHRFHKYITGKPFSLSLVNQTQELFILTTEENPVIYRFDTNENEIYSTNETFVEYIDSIVDWGKSSSNFRCWIGELLIPVNI